MPDLSAIDVVTNGDIYDIERPTRYFVYSDVSFSAAGFSVQAGIVASTLALVYTDQILIASSSAAAYIVTGPSSIVISSVYVDMSANIIYLTYTGSLAIGIYSVYTEAVEVLGKKVSSTASFSVQNGAGSNNFNHRVN